MKILVVSPLAPYDTVAHAGGKTHNFYIKRLSEKNEITILTCAQRKEINKIDLCKYNIDSKIFIIDSAENKKAVIAKIAELIIYYKYAGYVGSDFRGFILDEIHKAKENGYSPDCIILDWTQAVILMHDIRKVFRKIRIVAIEQDVSFKGLKRKVDYEIDLARKVIKYFQYKRMKRIEIKAVKEADRCFVFSKEDEKLLSNNGCRENIITIVPYYDMYGRDDIHGEQKTGILFYGAMNRVENQISAIWFIEKVMPELSVEWKFYIVGSDPPTELKKYESDRVIVAGYQKNITKWFDQSFCFVAPLLLGAGIKVKILEALSAGIPVLANSIAMEGIYAANTNEYFHCERSEDYINTINYLSENRAYAYEIGRNGRAFVEKNFNYQKTYEFFEREITSNVYKSGFPC